MLKFIFLHKNEIKLSIWKKLSDGYLLNGWFTHKESEKVSYDSSNFYSLSCVSDCTFPIYSTKKISVYSTDGKHGNLKNLIDEKEEIVKVTLPEDEKKDLRESLKKYDYFLMKSRFNDGKIYIGNDEEIINYLTKKIEKYKEKMEKEEDAKAIKNLFSKIEKTENKLMTIKNEQITNLKSKNKDLIESLDGVKEQISKSILWDNQFQPKYDNKKAEDFYDIIVNINSIKGIKYGWPIRFNEKGKKHYNEMKTKESLKIGIIGNGNKGKSFFLQKLAKVELPKGTSIKTEGLSLKYPEFIDSNNNIILLDSAGLETPLLKDENIKERIKNKEEEKSSETKNSETPEPKSDIYQMIDDLSTIAKDKALTELFLQNFIITESDILIAMVGILTYSEQKLLNRIKTDLKKKKKNYSLYVIHNLQTYVEIEQVETYIKETIM